MNPARATRESGESAKLKHELYIGEHHLVTDEAAEVGGEDLGPSPHEYLEAALAACTALTLRLYASRKGWPLENAETVVTYSKDGEISRLDRKITLEGALDAEQRARLLEIARKCPVHKILAGRIEISTALAGTPGAS